MDESKSFTHLQHTSSPNSVDRINTLSLPSAGLLCKVFFFHRASPEPTVSSHTEMTPFQCNICHFVRPFLETLPVPSVGRGHLSPLGSTFADWEKCLGTAEPFFPVLCVCFSCSHDKVLWKVTDGQWLFMSTLQFVSFLEASAWPSLDTCSAPGTNINQNFKVGKVTVELSGDGCNEKGNYWLTFKGTRKKTE